MEEIENRFKIIRIAVKLGDDKAIDQQMACLRNLSTDTTLHAIMQELENRNFRQALQAMEHYSPPSSDFFAPEEDAESSEGYFEIQPQSTPQNKERLLGLDEMLDMTRESASDPRPYSHTPPEDPDEESSAAPSDELDPLFSLDQEIVPPLSVPEMVADTPPVEAPVSPLESRDDSVASDGLFGDAVALAATEARDDESDRPDTESLPAEEPEPISEERYFVPAQEPDRTTDDIASDLLGERDDAHSVTEDTQAFDAPLAANEQEHKDEHEDEQHDEADHPLPSDATPPESSEETSLDLASETSHEEEGSHYASFPYMDQKFRNMMHQYPQCETLEEGISSEVREFVEFVSSRDYTEAHIEAVIAHYTDLKEQNRRAEAAQMLIAAAATESTFAQFMLARELFKGDVLLQDYPEAFTQINRLAEEDYPEAICDLGQLYEYGIGISKNKQHALLLYEEAAELGVERAKNHCVRLRSSNPIRSIKALTSSLLRRKQ